MGVQQVDVQSAASQELVPQLRRDDLLLHAAGGQIDDCLGTFDHIEPTVQRLGLLAGSEVFFHQVFLGLFQQDVNVIWDLAPHDISIMDYLMPFEKVAVSATGSHYYGNGIVPKSLLTIYMAADVIAHINVSWVSPVKIRQTLARAKELGILVKIELFDKLPVGRCDFPWKRNFVRTPEIPLARRKPRQIPAMPVFPVSFRTINVIPSG